MNVIETEVGLEYKIVQIAVHTVLVTNLTAKTWLKWTINCTENEKYFVGLNSHSYENKKNGSNEVN